LLATLIGVIAFGVEVKNLSPYQTTGDKFLDGFLNEFPCSKIQAKTTKGDAIGTRCEW
jgi:hypothetical protein